MAKSTFDMSLLKPVQSGWDESKLKPVDEEEEEIPYTPPPARKGVSGIWKDVKDIPGKVIDYAANVPIKATESWGQIFNHPGRALKNILAGAGETFEAPINLLGSVGPYLKERGITEKIPGFHTPDLGIEKALGIDNKQQGDELLRQMFMFGGIPSVINRLPGLRGASQRIKAVAEHDPLLAKVEELQAQHGLASEESKAASDDYRALKNYLDTKRGTETSSPYKLEGKAAIAEKRLQELQQQAEKTPEHLRANEEPIAPDMTNVDELPKTLVSDEHVKAAENELEKAANNEETHEAAISEHLGEGNAHRKRVAAILNPILEERQAEIGRGYDSYISGLKGKNVELTNSRDAKTITEDIKDILKTGNTSSKEMMKLIDELEHVGKSETVSAGKFVAAYRTLRQEGQKIRSSAYGKNPDEFNRLTDRADKIEEQVKRMEGIINKGLGEDNLKELHALNHRYATEVAPLFKNKFYQHMQSHNKAPKSMMEHLTNEPYIKSERINKVTGTQILNDIIKNDPELLKNVVGEKYAANPSKLHEWDETAQQFIQHMPELKTLRSNHFEAKQATSQSKMALEKIKREHQLALETAAEKDRLVKKEKSEENKQKKNEHIVKEQHYKLQKEIKKLENNIMSLKENAKNLHERANKRNISLKKKIEIEKELSDTKKRLAVVEKDVVLKKRLMKSIGYTAAAAVVGAPVYQKVKSYFGGK